MSQLEKLVDPQPSLESIENRESEGRNDKLSRHSTMAARISTDMVGMFSGEGNSDVVAWLEKAKLVAALSGITELQNFF